MKPYYQRDGITIYHGDNREILPALPRASFDLAFTSPPYNLKASPWPHLGNWKPGATSGSGGKGLWRGGVSSGHGAVYDEHDDAMPWGDYVRWQQGVLTECWRLTADSGAVFYNHKPRVVGEKLWTPLELVPTSATVRQIVIWTRGGGMNFLPSAYVPTHEWVVVLAKPAFRLRDRGASGVGDVWYVPAEPSPHPAPFPIGLPRRAIDTTGARSVIDPHAGWGTTLVAAKEAGVQAVGIEKSERYIEMAINRLAQGVLFGEVPAC